MTYPNRKTFENGETMTIEFSKIQNEDQGSTFRVRAVLISDIDLDKRLLRKIFDQYISYFN
jgi:hypothetical protein